jgi:hypothetical protein
MPTTELCFYLILQGGDWAAESVEEVPDWDVTAERIGGDWYRIGPFASPEAFEEIAHAIYAYDSLQAREVSPALKAQMDEHIARLDPSEKGYIQ